MPLSVPELQGETTQGRETQPRAPTKESRLRIGHFPAFISLPKKPES